MYIIKYQWSNHSMIAFLLILKHTQRKSWNAKSKIKESIVRLTLLSELWTRLRDLYTTIVHNLYLLQNISMWKRTIVLQIHTQSDVHVYKDRRLQPPGNSYSKFSLKTDLNNKLSPRKLMWLIFILLMCFPMKIRKIS